MDESSAAYHTREFLETCSPTKAKQISQLLDLQEQHLKLKKQYQEEQARLESEHHKRCNQLYTKRYKIINESRPQITLKTDNTLLKDSATTISNDQNISDFWLKVLKSNPVTKWAITEEDEAALKFLRDIRLELIDMYEFSVIFDFDSNHFFSNKSLTKTFHYERDPDDYTGDLVYADATGDTIDWKEGWSLVSMVVMNEKTKEGMLPLFIRTLLWFSANYGFMCLAVDSEDPISVPSFFKFFNTVKNSASEEDESRENSDDGELSESDDYDEKEQEQEDDDEDESEEDNSDEQDNDLLETHFEIGEELKESIIPYAIHWYTGVARLFEDSEDDDADEARQ